jgi:SNF family Na+-dependent transporter
MEAEMREKWATRIGLILAMAGNAIGLGNFLRFPVQAVNNGGGAFMIPYLFALLFLGIPLMWLEWAIGRYGGNVFFQGTCPGIFYGLTGKKKFSYLGVLALWVPLVIAGYYIYIEAWILAYAFYSLIDHIPKLTGTDVKSLGVFMEFFKSVTDVKVSYVFYLAVLLMNFIILYKGIVAGIERFAKIAMPLLFIFAFIIMVRVLLLETPNGTAIEGLNFMWYPDFEKLLDPHVWIAAAGQIFFTLSLGMGAIAVYASYIPRNADITLSGLTVVSLNEFAEVILGGTIAIPAACAIFGVAGAQNIAKEGAFTLGFVVMPGVFSTLPLSNIFSFLWFLLLMFAALTSSIALVQPLITFLEDNFFFSRKKAVIVTFLMVFLLNQIAIFVPDALDEMDLWAGTIIIVLTALIEVIVAVWVYKGDILEEINRGGYIKVPGSLRFVLKYITSLYLIALLASWFVKYIPIFIAKTDWNALVTRVILIVAFILLLVLAGKVRLREVKE